jgi:DNA-directed RNA polymerase subunit K/omega
MDPEEYISESEIESDGEEVESSKPNLPLSNNRSVDDLENELDDEDVVDLEDDEEFDDVDEDEGIDNDEEDLDNELQTTNNVRNQNIRNFDLSDDDDDESDDENYLQKFEDNMKENIIEKYHPELKSHNYEEVNNLAKIVRNEYGEIIDPLHKSLPFITKYEKSRIIGERAKQINAGAQPLISVEPNMIDGYLIALKEFEEKKTPFIIKRPMPNGGCEYWKLSDLEVLI